jgi:putative endonuclease
MYYVYVLYSLKDHNFYTGSTSDLKRRIKEHFSGNSQATSYRLPLKLVYYESYILKPDALAREKYLKTSMGKRVIKKQLHFFLLNQTN